MYIDFMKISNHDKAVLTKVVHDCGFLEKAAPIAFNIAIPLDGSYVMDQGIINQGTSFYPVGEKVEGGGCYLRLVADGSISPNFWGMARDSSSQEYQTDSGAVNCVYVWFDGTQVLYRIFHTDTSTLPPAVLSSGAVDFNNATRLIFTYNHPLAQLPVPTLDCFTVIFNDKPSNVLSVTVDNDDYLKFYLNIDTPIDYLQSCLVSYTPPVVDPLLDGQGYTLAGFSQITATRPD